MVVCKLKWKKFKTEVIYNIFLDTFDTVIKNAPRKIVIGRRPSSSYAKVS